MTRRPRTRRPLGTAVIGVVASLAVSGVSVPSSAAQAVATTVPVTTATTVPPTTLASNTLPPTTAPPTAPTTAAPTTTTTTTIRNQTAIISITEAPVPAAAPDAAAPSPPPVNGTAIIAVAPAPVAPGSAPAQPPPVALRVPPAASRAPVLSSPRQVAEVLEAAAARRRELNARVVEAESTVVRLDAEVASANAAVAAMRSQNQELTARLAEVEDERRLHEQASFSAPTPPPPAEPATPNNPLAALWDRAVNLGRRVLPDPPASAVLVSDGFREREYALRRQAQLNVSANDLRQHLEAAQSATADAEAGLATKAQELEAAKRSLAEARAALSSAMADVTFAPSALGATLSAMGSASALALADIPGDYLGLYQAAAAACPALSWTVLAAIGAIESAHGRAAAPGVHDGANFAGAMGPMQFLGPTWAEYGLDGNADGTADVYNPVDAIYGAANYLCSNGAGDPGRLGGALWAYNHADWYVRDVLDLATRYGGAGLHANAVDGVQLLANPNLRPSPQAAADLAAGLVDQRVVAVLAAITVRHRITLGVIETGHAMYVKGTDRISNHYYGRAVDIYEVDGAPVSPSNDAAMELAVALLTANSSLRPDELGSPWPELSQFPGAFTDADHLDHLHLGWRANPADLLPEKPDDAIVR